MCASIRAQLLPTRQAFVRACAAGPTSPRARRNGTRGLMSRPGRCASWPMASSTEKGSEGSPVDLATAPASSSASFSPKPAPARPPLPASSVRRPPGCSSRRPTCRWPTSRSARVSRASASSMTPSASCSAARRPHCVVGAGTAPQRTRRADRTARRPAPGFRSGWRTGARWRARRCSASSGLAPSRESRPSTGMCTHAPSAFRTVTAWCPSNPPTTMSLRRSRSPIFATSPSR